MWRWAAVWHLCTALLVAGTIDFSFFKQKRFVPSQVDCYDVPSMKSHRFRRSFDDGWRSSKMPSKITMSTAVYPRHPLLNTNEIISRRLDHLLPVGKELVKEHAKLVQDINGLKQVVFISPFVEDNRDYDDSVFHEMIETSTTARPTPPPPSNIFKPTPALQSHHNSHSIPVILLGGESQNDLIKTTPMRFTKPINLVGTSVSPLMKHPYPFVMQAKSQRPFKFCMQPMSMMYTTTQRPSLLQRIINAIIPR